MLCMRSSDGPGQRVAWCGSQWKIIIGGIIVNEKRRDGTFCRMADKIGEK